MHGSAVGEEPVLDQILVTIRCGAGPPPLREQSRVPVIVRRPAFGDLAVVIDVRARAADDRALALPRLQAQIDVLVAVDVRFVEAAAFVEQRRARSGGTRR